MKYLVTVPEAALGIPLRHELCDPFQGEPKEPQRHGPLAPVPHEQHLVFLHLSVRISHGGQYAMTGASFQRHGHIQETDPYCLFKAMSRAAETVNGETKAKEKRRHKHIIRAFSAYMTFLAAVRGIEERTEKNGAYGKHGKNRRKRKGLKGKSETKRETWDEIQDDGRKRTQYRQMENMRKAIAEKRFTQIPPASPHSHNVPSFLNTAHLVLPAVQMPFRPHALFCLSFYVFLITRRIDCDCAETAWKLHIRLRQGPRDEGLSRNAVEKREQETKARRIMGKRRLRQGDIGKRTETRR